MFSFLGRAIASIAAALGFAAVARTYSEPPEERPGAAGGPAPNAPTPEGSPGPGEDVLRAQSRLRIGWSRPKPEKIPGPTYWPATFGLGLMFVMWGWISNIFVWGAGFIMLLIAVGGWIKDLLHEFE